jgi:hypothetical protein
MSDANGTDPAGQAGQQSPVPEAEPGGAGEKILGAVGLIFVAIVGAVALDLLTGGAVSRAFGLGPIPEGGEPGGNADRGSG